MFQPGWGRVLREKEQRFTFPQGKEDLMSADDKFDNKAEELKGKAKEAVGDATGNEQWQAEGKADQVKGNLKQAAEKVKDAFKS
jgi:uncharacterized protein YjbJ (UPF0337 family)